MGWHLSDAVLLLSLVGHIVALCLLAVADVARQEGLCADQSVDAAGTGACGPAVTDHRRHGLLVVLPETARPLLCGHAGHNLRDCLALGIPMPAAAMVLSVVTHRGHSPSGLSCHGHLWHGCHAADGPLRLAAGDSAAVAKDRCC